MGRLSPSHDGPAKRRRLDNRNEDAALTMPEMAKAKSPNVEEKPDDVDEDTNSGSEDEPDEPPYNESQEQFPRCPAFDPEVCAIKARAKSAITRLADVLEEYSSVNKDLENMRLKCDEVMKSKLVPQSLALLGGTGAGKTSLLNALVDIPGVAKELSAGESCTSVPMVFKHKLIGQTQDFAAKVSYYSLKDCREILEEQLGNYNRFTFYADEYWTDAEREEYHQQAETASLTFRTLFCDERQFESPGETKRTLAQTFYTTMHENLLDTMRDWCAVRLREKSKEDETSYTFCQGESTAELRNNLDPLISPKHDLELHSLWPLVTEVQVGVPSSRVLQNLTVHDLPGITDTNRIRVNATNDHIRKCQALWYVASVERLCTDPDLDYHIRSYAQRFPGTLAVVVTKIDRDVTDALARDMREEKGQSIGDFHNYKDSIKENNRSITSLRRRLKRKTLTAAERMEVTEQVEILKTEIETLESQKLECIVDARNSHIVTRLKKEKSQYLRDGQTLPVFCCSNFHYAVHKKAAQNEGAMLDVNSTGIPELRSYALRLAAPAIWNDHKEILVHRVNVLFHGVLGWTENHPAPRDRALPEMIKDVGQSWTAISKDSEAQCIKIFSKEVMGKLRAENAKCMEAARSYCRRITEGWKPVTFLAFFRHEGKHTTHAVGSHSWNESFLEYQVKNVLKPAWERWPNPETAFDNGVEKLITELQDIPERLERMPESVPLPITAFKAILKAQIALIRAERDRVATKYKQHHGNIRLDASLDQHSGYFTQAMKLCYDQGKDDRGEGVCARDQKLLSEHLKSKDPFKTAAIKLENTFNKVVRAQERDLSSAVKKILAEIDHQFELILRKEVETPEECIARAQISEVLSELMPDIARIEPDLDDIVHRHSKALVPTWSPATC